MSPTPSPQRIDPLRRGLDRGLTRPMVALSFVFLFLLAGALPQLEEHMIHGWLVGLAYGGMLAIWPLFLVEFFARQLYIEFGGPSWRRSVHGLAVCIVPPLRITLPPATAPRCIWIPTIGWRRTGKPLYQDLKRAFNAPMIVIALMILPVLAADMIWRQQLTERPLLGLAVDVGARLIWLAFAVELVVMLAASRAKLAYCIKHWIDIAIVVFPLIAYLRILRLLRLGQVVKAGRLAQMTRLYRVRGLALRFWRALLLFEGLERLSVWTAEKRLAHLKGTLAKRTGEVEELKHHIAQLEGRLVRARAERKDSAGPGDSCDSADPVDV